MNLQEFEKLGVSREDEKDVSDILEKQALTTKEFAEKFSDLLPNGSEKITVSNARQKLLRAEKKDRVYRKKIHGIWYWVTNEKESTQSN